MKKASKARTRVPINKGGMRLPADLGPAKSYLAFWCMQDERLGKFKDEFAAILKRAVTDPDFKGRLLANTDAVLKEFGITLQGLTVNVVDNSYDTLYLAIPRFQSVAGNKCGTLADADMSSKGEKSHCIDDFNAGDWGGYKADLKDHGDPHTADR